MGEAFGNQRELAGNGAFSSGRDGARPLQGAGVGLMRRGEVTPPCGSATGGAQQRADVGIGPYEKKEIPLQPPGPAAHSGAFAARMGGVGGDRGRDHPRRGQQCRTIPQSACG